MKRLIALLLSLLLCLSLAACRRYLPENPGSKPEPEPAPVTEPEPVADEPVQLKELNVEFAVDGRDALELLSLQGSLPDALRKALSRRNVEVETIDVTFGTSSEATVNALNSGAVQLAFLSAEDCLSRGAGTILATELSDVPELSLGVAVLSRKLDNTAVTEALRDALPELASVLSHYTGEAAQGVYSADETRLAQLTRLYETGNAVLCEADASVGSRTLTLRGVGHRLNSYLWGVSSIEVWEGDTLLQTIAISEASDDPNGGPGEYTECPEPELLLRAVDVSFDGCDDIEVFGWLPNNTIPYFYWVWNVDAQRYEYSFRLQGPTIDAKTRLLSADYRESAALSWHDIYEWQNGELVLVSHEATSE